jgi:hypothetical protein
MFEIAQIEQAMPKQTFVLFTEGLCELEEMSRWTLVGGTALSLRYHHRLSEDLDFFVKHSTLEQSKKSIWAMMSRLEEMGFDVVKVQEDDRNLDFEIFGVKVTFFASGLDNLKEQCKNYKNIEIASVDTITAMKMDAIINYRTRSRDFYDIYTISCRENRSLFEMLDSYNQQYNQKTKESELLYRFLDKPLDSSDEGLSEMNPTDKITFVKLRRWIANETKINRQKETEIINVLLENPHLISDYSNNYFGFERISLLQKFASIYEPQMVLKALDTVDLDIGYKSISGKNILDYYLEDKEMFKTILSYAKTIPDAWMNSRMYELKGMREMILLENSLINCVKNKSNLQRVEKVAKSRGVELDLFNEMVEKKREVFRRKE